MRKAIWRRNAHSILLALCLVVGCVTTTSRKQAIAVAKQAAAERGWKEFKVGIVVEYEGNWEVEIVRLRYDGNSTTFVVSKGGELIDSYNGF